MTRTFSAEASTRSTTSLIPFLFVCLLAIGALVSCGEDIELGPRIKPHLSPLSFGDLHPRPSGTDPDPYSNTYVPFEWTLLLQSIGTDPVLVEEICIVGDNHNGEPGDNAFSFEGPDILEIPAQREAAVRITYDHTDRNIDLDGDGEPDPDHVALIVQSNAMDFPTLVVPICGRIVSTSREPETFECVSPVQAPAEGVADRDLCSFGG